MKRLMVILLLLSVGLNVGLFLRVSGDRDDRPWAEDRGPRVGPGEGPGDGFGEGRGEGRGQGRDGRRPGAEARYEGLDLTDEQHDRLMALREVRHETAGRRRTEMRELFDTMQDLLLAEALDREAVDEVRRRMAVARAEIDSLVAEQLIRELEIMTPEQRARYLERMPWDRFGKGRRRGTGR